MATSLLRVETGWSQQDRGRGCPDAAAPLSRPRAHDSATGASVAITRRRSKKQRLRPLRAGIGVEVLAVRRLRHVAGADDERAEPLAVLPLLRIRREQRIEL